MRGLEITCRVEFCDALTRFGGMKGFVFRWPRWQQRHQLLANLLRVAHQCDVSRIPLTDMGSFAIDLDQRHSRDRRTKTGCPEIKASTENYDAVCLIDVTSPYRVSERTDNPNLIRVPTEHLPGPCRGENQSAEPISELFQGISRTGAVCAQTSNNQGPLTPAQTINSRLNCLGSRRLCLGFRYHDRWCWISIVPLEF